MVVKLSILHHFALGRPANENKLRSLRERRSLLSFGNFRL